MSACSLLTPRTIKSYTPSHFCAPTCTQRQINTALTSLKCTSPTCFPLKGPVPVRTLAQNSQSASSVEDSLSDSTSPACLEMCLLRLYAALPASFTTTKKKKTQHQQPCSSTVWTLCKYCLEAGLLVCILVRVAAHEVWGNVPKLGRAATFHSERRLRSREDARQHVCQGFSTRQFWSMRH